MEETSTDHVNEATAAVLRAIKGEYKLTDAEIAAESNRSRESINRYLTGKRDVPLEVLLAVANLSKVPASTIIEDITGRVDESREGKPHRRRPRNTSGL